MTRFPRSGRVAALAAAFFAAMAAAADVTVDKHEVDARTHEILGTNPNPWPAHVEVSFPILKNLRPDRALPARATIPPRTRRMRLVRLVAPRRGAFNYSYRWQRFTGDPDARPDPGARYVFPFAHGTKHRLGQGYDGRLSHTGESRYALDFHMARGTPVHAAREGVVIDVVDDFTREGLDPAAGETGNRVLVLHRDGTFATYGHLQPRGAKVRPGDRVRAGQPLGQSGNTGSSSGPHLHFQVSVGNGRSVPVVMVAQDGTDLPATDLVEGRWYYAAHPGGPAFRTRLGHVMTDASFAGWDSSVSPHGEVRLESEKVDDTTILWLENGLPAAVDVDVELDLTNMDSSKGRSYRLRVPATTRAYAGLLRPGDFRRDWRWRSSFRYSRVRTPRGR